MIAALTDDDVAAIDDAGAKGMHKQTAKTFVRRAAVVTLAAAVGLGVCGFLGIDVL